MKNVADIYALSPMQKLMLLHARTAAGADDILFNQSVYALSGPLDSAVYRQAWQHLVDRHPALRTIFVWQDGKEPLQVVREQAELSWQEHDWRERPPQAQEAALDALLREDRAGGFDPLRAPLMRLHFIHRAPQAYWLVWSSHHLILDRGSIAPLLGEAAAAYEAICAGTGPLLPPAPRYRDYIAWLAEQDEAQTRRFWQEMLAGLAARPLPLGEDVLSAAAPLATERVELPAVELARLREAAAGLGVTLNTLITGMWAILVAGATGGDEALLGLTVAGRPPELPQLGRAVGSFINNVPLRVPLAPAGALRDWLGALQDRLLALGPHEHASPAQIREWTGVQSLFDNLLIFQAPVEQAAPDGVEMALARAATRSGYPLTLSVVQKPDLLRLLLTYERERVSSALVTQFVAALPRLLGMVDPAAPLTLEDLRRSTHISVTETAGAREPAPPAGASGRAYIPPRTAVEQALAQLWADVLGLPHVGVEDSFFALGGDSISAIQLLDGVERRLGARLPVTLLFSDATVAQMAEALTAQMAGIDVDPILLPINRSGDGAPLFYAHGVFGDVSSLTNLVPLLPPDQPLYGLQAIGLHPDYAPDETLEAMAAHYVEAIQGVQPRGPYRLGGFCFGGVLAYETARQLEARGELIALLAIIEGSAPREFHQPRSLFHPARLAVARQSIPQLLRGNEEFGGWRLRQRLGRRLRSGGSRPKSGNGRDAWEAEFDNLGDYNAARPPIQHRLKEINIAAIGRYRPQPINARVTLFRARYLPIKHTFLSPIDPERGWGALARGGVDIRYVDGSHIGVLRQPHAQDLARALAQALAENG